MTAKSKFSRSMLATAMVSALLLGPASPALADQPTTAAGTFTLVDLASRTVTLERTADGNQFFAVRHETPAYSGGLVGIAIDNYELIVHADGSVNGQGTETCSTCTIGGRTGDYTATFTFQGTTAQIAGHITFQSGAGGLAGLHGGGGTFQGSTSGTYAYQFQFAP